MHTMASEDTEITLGVGKLLGLFFLLAAICGVFFSIGYSLGKSSGREQALNDQPAAECCGPIRQRRVPDRARTSPLPQSQRSRTAAARFGRGERHHPAEQLTFYKAVQQNDNATARGSCRLTPRSEGGGSEHDRTGTNGRPRPAPGSCRQPCISPTVISHTSPVTGPGTIVVQIAAVSREDDAVSLAGALRKKNYNVFVVNNPVTNDKLYHVQVGPFATMPEAEAMKASWSRKATTRSEALEKPLFAIRFSLVAFSVQL